MGEGWINTIIKPLITKNTSTPAKPYENDLGVMACAPKCFPSHK
jgi:hypothetical protein